MTFSDIKNRFIYNGFDYYLGLQKNIGEMKIESYFKI